METATPRTVVARTPTTFPGLTPTRTVHAASRARRAGAAIVVLATRAREILILL